MSSNFHFEYDIITLSPEAKMLTKSVVCSVHKRSASIDFSYDNTGLIAYLSKCCCEEMADEVVELLDGMHAFQKIEVEYIKPKD